MNPNSTTFDDEARARITWGEPPERVLEYLRTTGWGETDASALVARLQRERAAQVRCEGIVKMLSGVGLFAAGLVVFDLGVSMTWLFGGGAICLGGVAKATQGVFMLLVPQTDKGDLSDPNDEK